MEIIKAKTEYQTVQVNIPSASILSGSGAPVTTPVFVGQRYEDLVGGYIYEAMGTSSTADWKCIYFPLSYVRRKNGLTRGSTNTNVVIYGTAVESAGTDITYVNSATAGDSFTVNKSGIYSVSVFDVPRAGLNYVVIKVGALTNGLGGTTKRMSNIASGADFDTPVSWTGYVAAGESIWTAVSTTSYPDADAATITITRLR